VTLLNLIGPLFLALVVALAFARIGAITLFHPAGEEAAIKLLPWQITIRRRMSPLTEITDKIKGLAFLLVGSYLVKTIIFHGWPATIEQIYSR
jgi:hypothetical protein